MFSSGSFMVPSLTLKYLIHFELIFVSDVWYWSNFTFLHVAVQFSQHHLLKMLSFSPLYSLGSFRRNWLYILRFISDFSILFCLSTCLFLHQNHTVLIILALQCSLKSGSMMPVTLLFLKIALAIQSFMFLRIVCSISVKNAVDILIGLHWVYISLRIV